MPNIIVTYGNGDPKKGSVRMKPVSAKHEGSTVDTPIKIEDLGDIYVSRSILKSLDIKDTGTIEVSFSNPDSPL